jgi:hypothetical protein
MVFKARILGLMAVTLLAPVIACGGGNAPTVGSPTPRRLAEGTRAPDAWETFTSPEHHYSIDYLTGWEIEPADSPTENDVIKSPLFQVSGDLGDATAVAVSSVPSSDLAAGDPEYADRVREFVQTNYHRDAKVIGVYSLGGREGLFVEWDNGDTPNDAFVFQVSIPEGGWTIVMTSLNRVREEYDEIFRQMLDSFEPKE